MKIFCESIIWNFNNCKNDFSRYLKKMDKIQPYFYIPAMFCELVRIGFSSSSWDIYSDFNVS